MTDKEILENAIEIAVLNGWSPKYMEVRFIPIEGIFNIIFSHSFAKAFGEKIINVYSVDILLKDSTLLMSIIILV